MGNSNTKESRSGDNREAGTDGRGEPGRSRNRLSRGDLSGFLNLQSSTRDRDRDRQNAPFERRETKQEREARRLERDRAARAKERERSLREEHVDGGFLVTLGTYTGIEDFSKPVVRQLQIERKLAPFWRGLNDWSANWAEHQLVAAARGLPIPAADTPPDPGLMPRPRPSEPGNLTVSMGERTLSAASDRSEAAVASDLPSPAATGPVKSSSFKPRAKAIAAALSVSSRNASATDLAPKEIALPNDPFVNGQPIEVFLYKEADDCPICFLSYPPYLNRTRCCDQPICSECFVQIKRADPHLPEHHPDGQARDPNQGLTADDPPEMLISEPSACPYCQQPEFGVTYEPPPFRRGLAFSAASSALASSTAMSSQSSLNSTPPPMSPQQVGRRRTHSLSATAPNVITTDRVRPDWATKLAAARAHQARRAAAATALHTAAFLVGGNEQRSLLRSSRFGRRNTGSNGSNTPAAEQSGSAIGGSDALQSGEGGSSNRHMALRRRTRMEELEEMMFMEAVRLSLASEEDRKHKEDKAQRKEEKKRQQAERKAQKKQGKDPYGGGVSGASASSLSLGLGRMRGNSAASNLRMEATLQGASSASRMEETQATEHEDQDEHAAGKGKGVDRAPREAMGSASTPAGSLNVPPCATRSGSHLRQMSNTSSLVSSSADSPSGSYSGQGFIGPEGGSPSRVPRVDDADPDTGNEPLFNFRSLAELVGVNIEDGSSQAAGGDGVPSAHNDVQVSGRPLSRVNEEEKEEDEAQPVEDNKPRQPGDEKTPLQTSIKAATEGAPSSQETTAPATPEKNSDRDAAGRGSSNPSPGVALALETSMAADDAAADDKSVGRSSVTERPSSTAH
ncbi:protein SIP5 [Hirsutella rhossiliensis]|uniref:Protein SIP5 n=1 Tax=Hirsutella rhossiliensis TaxID=111463 RepID=A0A9P8MUH1_9HYPO|nr:protein SIP5 [Hirsutella rhossiliensis]KAH0961455.1 protein SIP5 [Hirsutella rhossiliensis]